MAVMQRQLDVVTSRISRFIAAPEGFRPDYVRFYVLGQFGYPIGLMGYGFFLAVFMYFGLWSLVFVNVAAITIVILAFMRHSKGHINGPACVVLLGVIPVHSLVTTLSVGAFSAFWLETLVSISVIQLIPTFQRATRVILAFVLSAYAIFLSVSGFIIAPLMPVAPETEIALIGANIIALASLLIAIVTSFDIAVMNAEKAQRLEHSRAESLLLNILPLEIANRLKQHEEPLADSHDNVSVLFADLSGFTEISRKLSANQLVTLLNDLFSRFDKLTEEHGAEKIKTIGDAYMVATGLSGSVADHAERIADLALGMQQAFGEFRRDNNVDLKLRIGVHSGAVIAGVIGKQKFSYDLWGNTVNIASRMESEGIPDQIQISAETKEMLSGRFRTFPRGEIHIKGHRPRSTYFLGDQNWPFAKDQPSR